MSEQRTAAGTRWTNWSGAHVVHPRAVERAVSVPDVQAAVSGATREGRRIKPIGSGHSFTRCAVADDVMLDLTRMTGIVDTDASTGEVTVQAGTVLGHLNELLWDEGLALANLGDIDKQTMSGATMTGTHGTGAAFTGLAGTVTGLEIVLASGDVVTCSRIENPDLFDAARVSFGSLGVVTKLTYQCVPAFPMRAVETQENFDQMLSNIQHEADGSDHFEFHWFPHTKGTLTKRNTRLEPGTPTEPLPRWKFLLDDEVLSNGVYSAINRLSTKAPSLVPTINKVSAKALSSREYVDRSYRVFASPRRVHFNESEYNVPREHVVDVLRELEAWVESHDFVTPFPVEVRFAKADDVWLSTAYERESAYVAVHQYHRMGYGPYFEAFEKIVAQYAGRPHWGKLHTLGPDRLGELYPRFGDFLRVRDEVDPTRTFAGDYTRQVLTP